MFIKIKFILRKSLKYALGYSNSYAFKDKLIYLDKSVKMIA